MKEGDPGPPKINASEEKGKNQKAFIVVAKSF